MAGGVAGGGAHLQVRRLQQQGQGGGSSGGSSGGSGRASWGVPSPGGGVKSAGAGAGGGCVNVLGLPYRLVLAVATMDHVLLYDMQVNGVGCAWWGGGRGGGHIFK